MDIQVDIEEQNDIVILSVNEPIIDHSNSASLKEKLFLEIADGKNKIILDLTKVMEMDSSGLGALLFGKRQASHSGGNIFLVGIQPAVDSMLRIAQLSRVFDIFEKTDDAIAHFRS